MSASANAEIVRVEGLTRIYQLGDVQVPALRGVSLAVRRGETASSIAKKYGVATKDLLAWNKLSAKSVLHIGDKLVVQSPSTKVAALPQPARGTQTATVGTVRHIHAVAAGESAAAIAQQYDVSVETLAQWNGWTTPPVLAAGDEVVVFQPTLPQD